MVIVGASDESRAHYAAQGIADQKTVGEIVQRQSALLAYRSEEGAHRATLAFPI